MYAIECQESREQLQQQIILMEDIKNYKKCKEEFYLILSEYKIKRNHIYTLCQICNIFEKWGADEDDLKIQYYSNDNNCKKLINFLDNLVSTN